MICSMTNEDFTDSKVTYTIETNGGFYIIENVPARVSEETGEQFFAPETVEHLQQTVWGQGQAKPKRYVETPVFDFANR